MSYEKKYIKYKNKYLKLKELSGGGEGIRNCYKEKWNKGKRFKVKKNNINKQKKNKNKRIMGGGGGYCEME